MELVKQHQQDLRTATQFWHGARRVLTIRESPLSRKASILEGCMILICACLLILVEFFSAVQFADVQMSGNLFGIGP